VAKEQLKNAVAGTFHLYNFQKSMRDESIKEKINRLFQNSWQAYNQTQTIVG